MKASFFEVGIRGIFQWEALDPGHFALLISPTPGGKLSTLQSSWSYPRRKPMAWAIVSNVYSVTFLYNCVCLASFCLFSTFLVQFPTITKLQRHSALLYSTFCKIHVHANLYDVTKFPPYFPFTLYCFYIKISSFMSVSTMGIVGDSFCLLIIYSEKFSAWVCRLQ